MRICSATWKRTKRVWGDQFKGSIGRKYTCQKTRHRGGSCVRRDTDEVPADAGGETNYYAIRQGTCSHGLPSMVSVIRTMDIDTNAQRGFFFSDSRIRFRDLRMGRQDSQRSARRERALAP